VRRGATAEVICHPWASVGNDYEFLLAILRSIY
jgi:hypothetical protein